MKIKVMLLGISVVVGANFTANSAFDECTWQCIDDRIACLEASVDRATCDRQYQSCRAACNPN